MIPGIEEIFIKKTGFFSSMTIVLGIESTAHTFGIAVLRDREVLANERDAFTTESGGMIPAKVALHHEEAYLPTLQRALAKAGIKLSDVELIAYSESPGIGHTLRIGAAAAKSLALQLKVPLVGVNHCIAHLEIASLATQAKDPVLLYCSGANTQVIAYDEGKYRIFGETLDTGIGNFIDTVARDMGLGFPGGPKIERLALDAVRNWEENNTASNRPDTTTIAANITAAALAQNKGRGDERASASSTVARPSQTCDGGAVNLRSGKYSVKRNEQQIDELDEKKEITDDDRRTLDRTSGETTGKDALLNRAGDEQVLSETAPPLIELPYSVKGMDVAFAGLQTNILHKIRSGAYTNEDLAYSIQETTFAMLVEVAERALAHVGKDELVLGGGVACNKRLQEMCRRMCEDRGARFYCPANEFLVDNAAMIAWTGLLMHTRGNVSVDVEHATIKPYERTDDVVVTWK
jgi:glycoprotease/Kae1 family metallohydrolase